MAAKERRMTKGNLLVVPDQINVRRKSFEEDMHGGPLANITHAQMIRRASRCDPSLIALTQQRRMSIYAKPVNIQRQEEEVRYENTYKLEPDSEVKVHKVRDVMKECMKEWLADVDGYSPQLSKLAVKLTDDIKKRVKDLGYTRYKYVVMVTICQDGKQCMQMVSRCLWNKETDTFAEAVYKTADIYAIATLYAIYYE